MSPGCQSVRKGATTDRKGEVLAERVALEAVVGQDPPEVGVALEEDCDRAQGEQGVRLPEQT